MSEHGCHTRMAADQRGETTEISGGIAGTVMRGRTWCTVWMPTHRAYRVVGI
jgi:hypothetical protein